VPIDATLEAVGVLLLNPRNTPGSTRPNLPGCAAGMLATCAAVRPMPDSGRVEAICMNAVAENACYFSHLCLIGGSLTPSQNVR